MFNQQGKPFVFVLLSKTNYFQRLERERIWWLFMP